MAKEVSPPPPQNHFFIVFSRFFVIIGSHDSISPAIYKALISLMVRKLCSEFGNHL